MEMLLCWHTVSSHKYFLKELEICSATPVDQINTSDVTAAAHQCAQVFW